MPMDRMPEARAMHFCGECCFHTALLELTYHDGKDNLISDNTLAQKNLEKNKDASAVIKKILPEPGNLEAMHLPYGVFPPDTPGLYVRNHARAQALEAAEQLGDNNKDVIRACWECDYKSMRMIEEITKHRKRIDEDAH